MRILNVREKIVHVVETDSGEFYKEDGRWSVQPVSNLNREDSKKLEDMFQYYMAENYI